MNENNPAIIRETQNPAEADMIYEILKSNGIDCILLDRNASGQVAGFGPAICIKIAVVPEHREKALEILKSLE
ncbi:MAG: DUF2007 domain-containing protein [Elusimicrobia bacterium]|nr:DUF2007 domain-containing protein [Elusimicrobiota bacterium]